LSALSWLKKLIAAQDVFVSYAARTCSKVIESSSVKSLNNLYPIEFDKLKSDFISHISTLERMACLFNGVNPLRYFRKIVAVCHFIISRMEFFTL
jgi:L-cystine uptake protein TcyP (sodium:dicarboxylate symporter family)